MKSKDLLALAVSFAVATIVFTEAATTLAIAAIAVLGYFVFYVRSRKAIALTLSCGLSLIAFETIGSIVIRRAIARDYLPGRDHRMKPNPDKGINSDGILCDTEADAFADDAFNIIFLGDSFTFGLLLEDSNDAFPFQVERMIRARRPDLRANCINFGWTSSSPLLSYRLLTEIGSKYKPDIVVFALDLTDFHDDLLYRHHDDPMERSASAFMLHKAGLYNFYLQLRQRWRLGRLWSGLHGESLFIPDDRFFAVNQPLSLSQPYMLETEIQLRKIADYCKSTLNAEFIVVFPPRSFQYSAVECPDNWERHSYSVLGPFVRQPFVWFDHFKARVDFPCYSLLEALENAAEFPLFFRDDPHWTAAGHKVIAGAVMDILEKEGRLNSD
ncbi:MAG: SGNH/GDSL hydrolase family protein [Planctomycetota bacterium]|nr:SGNH/GDSL hydrolase family protein [Planctomycetota bacterium]